MDVKETIIDELSSRHNVKVSELFIEDLDGMYWLSNIKSAIDDNLTTELIHLKKTEPTWAITRAMLDRVYDQLTSGFISLFTGAWAAVEVICRASLEAAVNVLYVLEADTVNRISQYVTIYFEDSAKSIDRYEAIVMTLPGDNTVQLKSAADARNSLTWRKEKIEQIFQHETIPFGTPGWPKKVLDRFKACGKEFQYREIYASLSSQVHNDADALIDYMILTAYEQHIPDAAKTSGSEMLFWLRHFLYCCLEFYADAARSFAIKNGLAEAKVNIEQQVLLLRSRLKLIDTEFSHR